MNLDFAPWLKLQRWYAGRGREMLFAEAGLVVPLRDDLDLALIDVHYAAGSRECYQVLVRWSSAPEGNGQSRGYIGSSGRRHAYDAALDPASVRYLLDLIERSATIGPVFFEKEPGASLRPQSSPRVLEGEQTNTSAVFGDELMFKLFRRSSAGVNPDVEVGRVLTRAGDPHVPRILGSFSVEVDRSQRVLGVVTEFAKKSADGWQTATASVVDLLTTEDCRADEMESDFAADSFRLGQAVASVHKTLADVLGVSTACFPSETFVQRMLSVVAVHPRLGQYAKAIEDRYRSLDGKTITCHRVHGDLHLGQVLRTPDRWLLIDFEGEPGQPTEERRRPDSPLRDVAGMLRSFDYVGQHRMVAFESARAQCWVDRNSTAFCKGYAEIAREDPRESAGLLTAYGIDKAVYEVGYEVRHRPSWVTIPMAAIPRLLEA